MSKGYISYDFLNQNRLEKTLNNLSTSSWKFSRSPKKYHVTWDFNCDDDKFKTSWGIVFILSNAMESSFMVNAAGVRVALFDFNNGLRIKQSNNNKYLHITYCYAQSAKDTNLLWQDKEFSINFLDIVKSILTGKMFLVKRTFNKFN